MDVPPPLIIGIYYNLVIRLISGSNVPRNNNCEVDILQCNWKTKHLCQIQDNLQFNSSPAVTSLQHSLVYLPNKDPCPKISIRKSEIKEH